MYINIFMFVNVCVCVTNYLRTKRGAHPSGLGVRGTTQFMMQGGANATILAADFYDEFIYRPKTQR